MTLLTCATGADRENVAELREEGIQVETVPRERPSRAARTSTRCRPSSAVCPSSRTSRGHRRCRARSTGSPRRTLRVIQLESTLIGLLRFTPGSKLVLDEHNIEYENHARTQEVERSPIRQAFYAFEAARVRHLRGQPGGRVGYELTSARRGDRAGNCARHPDSARPERRRRRPLPRGAKRWIQRRFVFNRRPRLPSEPRRPALHHLGTKCCHRSRPALWRGNNLGPQGSGIAVAVHAGNVEQPASPDVRPYLLRRQLSRRPDPGRERGRFQGRRGLAVAAPDECRRLSTAEIGVLDGGASPRRRRPRRIRARSSGFH